jgi:capsid assembly protease
VFWLLHEDVLRKLQDAERQGRASDEQRAHFGSRQIAAQKDREARRRGTSSDLPAPLSVAAGSAEIRVSGVLVPQESFWLWLLGYEQTVWGDLLESIERVTGDESVDRVNVMVDSPGGSVDGMWEALAAFESLGESGKQVAVIARNAMSAAYGVAAVAGPITATMPGAMFGSVGVAIRMMVTDYMVDVTNTESPDKRPDVRTPEGKAVVQRELDAIFDLFVESIAKGRGTTTSSVVEGYGRGGSFLAGEAQRRGMIDSVAGEQGLRLVKPVEPESTHTSSRATPGKDDEMDIKTLRRDHRECYDEIFSAGEAAGVAKERDRVTAHLTLGATGGPKGVEVAHKAIREGTELTATVNAEYVSAAINQRDIGARQEDATKVKTGTANAEAAEELDEDAAYAKAVVERLEASKGKKKG